MREGFSPLAVPNRSAAALAAKARKTSVVPVIEVTLGPNDGGPRADRVLRKLLPKAPLALLHRLLRQGKVRVGKTRLSARDAVDDGSVLAVGVTPEQFAEFRGVARAARAQRSRLPTVPVVFEDEHLLVVDLQQPQFASNPRHGLHPTAHERNLAIPRDCGIDRLLHTRHM